MSHVYTLRHTLGGGVFIYGAVCLPQTSILRNLCDADKSAFHSQKTTTPALSIHHTHTHTYLSWHTLISVALCLATFLSLPFVSLSSALSSLFLLFIIPTVVSQPHSTHHSVGVPAISSLARYSFFPPLVLSLSSPSLSSTPSLSASQTLMVFIYLLCFTPAVICLW